MEGSRIDFLKEEERLRSILLRILIGIFIALASFLFSLALPFYPTSFAIVLALAVGALAYRSPTLSLAVMFFINMPGYLYQGGFHVAIVVVAGLVFFAATFTCLYRTGACLPVAAGVIAAGLMFTPLYFMSIPLLITVILFRARGIGTGSPLAALVFLAIYTPFLARGADLDTASQVVPLFQQVNFQPQPPIFTVELAVIFDKLRAAPGTDVDLAKFLGIYYLFVRNTDLSAAFTTTQPVGRLLGLVLYFIMIFSIFVAFITHSLYRWLEAQELGTRYHLEWIGPTLSLVIADVAFLVPISVLQGGFAYTTTLDSNTVTLMIVATMGIGLAGSTIEYWLRSRDMSLELRQRLNRLLPRIGSMSGDLQVKLSSIRGYAQQIDYFDEEKILQSSNQELGYIEGSVNQIPSGDLQDKIGSFVKLEHDLQGSSEKSEQKLFQYYKENLEQYSSFISRTREFGLFGMEAFTGLSVSELSAMGIEKALKEQEKLNGAYERLARYLLGVGQETHVLINEEVDQEFQLFGLDIARNYVEIGRSLEAIDSMLSELSNMGNILHQAALNLAPRITAVIKTWDEIIRDDAITTMRMVGNEGLIQTLLYLKPTLDKMIVSEQGDKSFAILIQLVKDIRELIDVTASIISQLLEIISDRVKIIESKVPRGFDWGKNDPVVHRLEGVQEQLKAKPKETSLASRLMNIELALQAIGEGISLIRQYVFENEFLISYSNIQYLIGVKLEKNDTVYAKELPVREKYAHRYLALYARNNIDKVTFDSHRSLITTHTEG